MPRGVRRGFGNGGVSVEGGTPDGRTAYAGAVLVGAAVLSSAGGGGSTNGGGGGTNPLSISIPISIP